MRAKGTLARVGWGGPRTTCKTLAVLTPLSRTDDADSAHPTVRADARIVLLRHGQTEWSRRGQHTGRTDLELTSIGRQQALSAAQMLAGQAFVQVWTSPLRRAAETATLVGHPDANVDADLAEWDYGEYEGRTTEEVTADRPGWSIWADGVPGGETLDAVAHRADRVLARALPVLARGDLLLVGHAHQLRILAARWLNLAPSAAALLHLDTASVSSLGYEHSRACLTLWNQVPSGLE